MKISVGRHVASVSDRQREVAFRQGLNLWEHRGSSGQQGIHPKDGDMRGGFEWDWVVVAAERR